MAIEVLVVGSLHFDILVETARLPRIGETFPGNAWLTKCGGKGGNQAVEAARHGAKTAVAACIGHDEFGTRLVRHLETSGVDTRFVRCADIGSGVSVAISDLAGDYAAIIVTGSNARLAETEIAAAARELSSSAILVLQNEVPEGANLVAARMARDCGARVIINAAPAREMSPELLDLVDVLIVNAVEAEMLGGGVVVDLASAAVAAERLGARVPAVIVTAGGHGLALRSGVGSATIGAHPVSLISTHGAGDAFVGALAAQLSRGAALETAAVYANAAAAVLVATPETERQNLTHEATHALLQRA